MPGFGSVLLVAVRSLLRAAALRFTGEMSQNASDEELCQQLLGFVTKGTYPAENVIASEFPASALSKELDLISDARERVEVGIPSRR